MAESALKITPEMTPETTFQLLPELVILKVFSFLAERRIYDLFRIRLVCKKWCRLSTDPSLWRKLHFPNCEGLCYEALNHVFSWGSDVKEVILSNCARVDDACVELIADKCPNLGVVDLTGCRLLTDCGLEAISRNCSQLRNASISAYKENVRCSVLKDLITRCKSLQELKITSEKDEDCVESFFNLTDDFFDAVQKSSSLKTIYLDKARILEEESIISNSNMFNFFSMGLPGCMELNNDLLSHLIFTSPQLQSLDVSFCPGIDDAGISTVAQFCPNLLQLIARGCPRITDVSIETVAENCKMLQCLNVCGCDLPRPTGNITDEAVQRIAENCPDLRQLNVHWCQGVTDIGIAAIATNCIKLSHLNICGCLGISDVSLDLVAKYCHELTTLEISECLRLTRSSINDIVQTCIELEYLDMQVCSYVSDLNFTSDKKRMFALAHADLSYCTKITDKTLKQMGQSCPRLKYLSVAGCHKISDTGIIGIACSCNELQYLDASFRGSQSCAEITSNSVRALALNCTNLTYLDMIGCFGVDEASIDSLVRSCRHLKQLNVSQFTERIDFQLLLHITESISLSRSSFSYEELVSPHRGGKLVQKNYLFKMSAPNL